MKSESLWRAFVMTLVSILSVGAVEIEDTVTKAVSTASTAAQYLHKLAKKLEQSLTSAIAIRRTAIQAASAYRIKAAFSQDKATQITFLAMAAVTEADLQTLDSQTTEAHKIYERAVCTIKQHEATMLTLHKTQPTTAKVSSTQETPGVELNSVTGMTTCTSTASFTADTTNCTLESETGGVKAADIEPTKHTKIKLVDLAKPPTTFTVTKHCKGTVANTPTASNAVDGACIEQGSDFGGNQDNAIATKLSKKTKNYQTVDVNLFTDATKTTCTQIDPKAAYTEYHKDTLGHALCTLRQLNKPTYTPIHRRPWTAVTADEKLLQALTDLITPGGKAPTDPQEKKTITDAYLGSDQNVFTAQKQIQ
uniref:Variant surface glycoprotein 1562 n=1 Tax=Trypanosoma brucei TaxID=5691 RepID=M4SYR3_9TRYP|nr:variant surface glycoprotein 1562 [Trypanosoma brucei]